MSKVTKKLQVSVPKALADQYGIRPGDDLQWYAAGDTLRVIAAHKKAPRFGHLEQLRLFDEATRRQRERETMRPRRLVADRGWAREKLYESRGSTR